MTWINTLGRTRTGAKIAILAFAFGSLIHATAGAASLPDNDAFATSAGTLLRGIEATDVTQISAASGYGRPRLALLSLRSSEATLSTAKARELNNRLMAELQRQGGQRFRYVARDAITAITAEIKASGTPADEAKARISELTQNARADILIVGQVRVERGEAVLSFQAVGAENGALYATTHPFRISLSDQSMENAENYSPQTIHRTSSNLTTDRGGAARRTVAETEALLVDRGYAPGPVDGIITAETRKALAAYQADSALPVNGRMTRQVVENLRRDTR